MARRKEPETGAPDTGADGVIDPTPGVAPVPEAMGVPPVPPVPEPPEPAPVASPPAPRRGGVLGPLLGGALAAIGGFGLSHFNVLGLAAPDNGEALSALEARLAEVQTAAEADRAALAALQGDLAPLADRLAALEAAPAPEPPEMPDLSRLDGLEDRLAAIEALPAEGDASTAALAAKLADLERRLAAQPQGVDRAEVEAALARLAEAEAEAAARAEEATAAAEAAARTEALDRLMAAVTSGAPFEAELAALADPALTDALTPFAAGVAPMEALQAEFPDLARQVLALARADTEADGWGARVLDFLAAQTGARSLTPREGDDPDAVLSRAEFALGEGRLADALTDLQALDPTLRAPLDSWIARAEARLAVLAALEGR